MEAIQACAVIKVIRSTKTNVEILYFGYLLLRLKGDLDKFGKSKKISVFNFKRRGPSIAPQRVG